MKVLVFGSTGQVAQALQRYDRVTALSRAEADLTDIDACTSAITNSDADVVINAAAYTAVDKAEDEKETAFLVNAAAPAQMAKTCAARDLPFLTISTDYVFDGAGDEPHQPDGPANPLNVYGASKAAGEEAVREAGGQHVILRTSWVFSEHGNNFVKTMLRVGQTLQELKVVSDQIGGPTAAADIADCLMRMAEQLCHGARGGTYHFSGAPEVSWAGFAEEIFRQSEMDVAVLPIGTAHYPTPALRPLNSRLDCRSLFNDFGISQPDWRSSLARVLAALQEGSEHES